jgi:glutamine synthetase
MATAKDVMKMMTDNEVLFVDLRFTDTKGKEQHVSVPAKMFDEDKFEHGHAFDGSSIAGWKGIEASDMLLMPDPVSARMDPFREENTLIVTCDVVEPSTGKGYDRDPRSLAKRAEAYLKSTGVGDTAYFGPEPEFFIFDSVTWNVDMSGCFVQDQVRRGALVHRHRLRGRQPGAPSAGQGRLLPGAAGRLVPGHPLRDVPAARAAGRRGRGAPPRSGRAGPERDRHQVLDAGEARRLAADHEVHDLERRGELRQDGDLHAEAGRRATTGRACTCTSRCGRTAPILFAGNGYGGLSDFALYYIGGIIKHARALNAITNPGTNSYKRLVPGFEAPVKLAYSARNRSASIRIPYVSNPKGRRIEVRFPDPTPIPYLAFAAMLMAGLDGVQNKIHPGEAADKNLYDLPPEEDAKIPTVCSSLDQALEYLDKDREFLTRGGVFSNDLIDAYIALKSDEVTRFRMTTHPVEFDMYYSS